MIKFTEQQRVANYMGAFAHLLSGRAGRHAEFIDKVEIIVSGAEPHALQLMQFTAGCRLTGRPTLWIRPNPEIPNVPEIGLVANVDGQARIYENCMLWLRSDGDRAMLVPDNFRFGAYRFDDNLQLKFIAKAPARSFKRAEPGMIHAYDRLADLEHKQLERGDIFALPQLAKAA